MKKRSAKMLLKIDETERKDDHFQQVELKTFRFLSFDRTQFPGIVFYFLKRTFFDIRLVFYRIFHELITIPN